MVFPDRARLLFPVAVALAAAADAGPIDSARAEERAHGAGASAVVAAPAHANQPAAADSELLSRAMRARVTINTDPHTGRQIAASHCRRAPEGCDRRMAEFAGYLTDAGQKNGLDPWLLAAMAFKESGFNPFAMGSLGELGILQLHPNNPRSKHVRFLHDEWYRKRCRHEIGACQKEVVDRAAELLARTVEQCGGSLQDALGAYNTGRCGGSSVYAKRIIGERKLLRQAVGLET